MIGEMGTLDAEPGLWVNVTKVAGIQADMIINELLRGTSAHVEMPGNTLLVANTYLDIIEGQENEPHTGLWIEIERDSDCLVCGERLKQGPQLAGKGRQRRHLAGRLGCVRLDDRYRIRGRRGLTRFNRLSPFL